MQFRGCQRLFGPGRWFFEDRGETACVPSPCIGAGSQLPYQDTSPGMGIFFKGAHMCGTKEDLPPEVKASAVCVIEGVSHAPPTPICSRVFCYLGAKSRPLRCSDALGPLTFNWRSFRRTACSSRTVARWCWRATATTATPRRRCRPACAPCWRSSPAATPPPPRTTQPSPRASSNTSSRSQVRAQKKANYHRLVLTTAWRLAVAVALRRGADQQLLSVARPRQGLRVAGPERMPERRLRLHRPARSPPKLRRKLL